MSFFGKQFKKTKIENATEFIGKLNLSEHIMVLFSNPDSITTFTQNDDGTVQYVVKSTTGATVFNQKIYLGGHVDFRAPDGMDTSVEFKLEGNVIRSHMHLPNGKVVYMDRHFDDNGMKLELYIKGNKDKATIYYEVV